MSAQVPGNPHALSVWVSKLLRSRVPEYQSAWVPWMLKYPSVLSAQLPDIKCQVHKYLGILREPSECLKEFYSGTNIATQTKTYFWDGF